jgi:RNA polymerase sigma factor (sigma-70 family)
MNLTASLKLLRDYADHGDEAAFRKLVEQYINLVYSVALRRVGGDASLAQDVTQAVFTDLARKAPSLRGVEYLGGWLHKHAGFVAANMVRSERRRQIREQEASQMNATDNSPDSLWQQLAPVLNDTIESLEPSDRQVILLRFFEQWDFRSIGTTLGISDDAAQKRVSRALDKVRIHFRRRGIVLSAVAIASVISANAVQAAPAGLASTVASASLAHAAGAWSFSLSSTYVQALFLKKTTYVLLLVALASALIIPISVFKARKSQSSAPITDASVRQGLVLDYKFDHGVVDGRIADASGAGNNGQINGAQWISDPQRGGVFQFSPPNRYILVPNSASLNPSNLTLAAWIKTSDQGDTWRRVFDKGWTDGFALSIAGGHTPNNTSQGKAVIEIAKSYSASSDRTVTDGQWHHVAMTYDGAEEILYIDGVRQKRIASWPGSVPSNSNDLTIGINLIDPNPLYDEVGASFDGLIDEPMMFNRALSPGEIKFLFNSQRRQLR